MDDTTPDLDKLRDEKCIPVAQGVLNDMAIDMMVSDGDLKPILVKVQTRALEADLNIEMEASYVFQLLLKVLAGLNATVQTANSIPVDFERYNGIAKKILSIVATANIRMIDVTPQDTEADFAPVKEQINELFAAEQLTLLEIKFIMDRIFNSFTDLNNMFSESLAQSSARAEAKLFGIESMSDLTLKKLDEVLTK